MTAAVRDTVSVSIVGKEGTIEVKTSNGDLVQTVVNEALKANGLDTDAASRLSVIKNGEDAELNDPVEAGDEVTAAPQVANG